MGAGRAQAPNDFQNNGPTSQALIRCIVLYFEELFPINQQLLPTALNVLVLTEVSHQCDHVGGV